MTARPWPWWALVVLGAAVLIIPTAALIVLRERALGVVLITAVAGLATAEQLEAALDRRRP